MVGPSVTTHAEFTPCLDDGGGDGLPVPEQIRLRRRVAPLRHVRLGHEAVCFFGSGCEWVDAMCQLSVTQTKMKKERMQPRPHTPRHGEERVKGAAGREIAEVDIGHAELLECRVEMHGDGGGPLRDDAEGRLWGRRRDRVMRWPD